MSKIKVEVVGRRAPRPRKRNPRTDLRAQALEGRRSTGARITGAAWWLLKPRVITWAAAALTPLSPCARDRAATPHGEVACA